MNTDKLIRTHKKINSALCGTPIKVEKKFCIIELTTTANMAVDESGLIHGGFIFGLADYAAMIAVNHPNVVLGAAEVKFIKPVRINETVTAEAKVESQEGKKNTVSVTITGNKKTIFKGIFTCFVLDRHVLDD